MDLRVGLNSVVNPEQTRCEAQMLYKGTNVAGSTVSISRGRSGALARSQPAAKSKEILRRKSGDAIWDNEKRTTILEHLRRARHSAECFTLEVDCAPNNQWKHNLTKQQQYPLKESDRRSVFSYCRGGRDDFYIVMKQSKL